MSDKPSSFKKLLKATKPSKSKSSSSESKKAPKLKDQSLITEIENLTKDKIFRADDNDVSQLRDLLLDTRAVLREGAWRYPLMDQGTSNRLRDNYILVEVKFDNSSNKEVRILAHMTDFRVSPKM